MTSETRIFQDMLDRQISLPIWPPKRVISLVPSLTQTIADLCGADSLVGVTSFCVHPQSIRKQAALIGGTKTVKIERIKELEPDIIFANKEENTSEIVQELEKYFPVYVTEVKTVAQSLEMLKSLGQVLNKEAESAQFILKINQVMDSMNLPSRPQKAAYLIWNDPIMTCGSDTFIHSVMQLAGFENAFQDQTRYPTVSIQDMQAAQLDYLLLSSEPYKFKQEHVAEFQSYLPNTKVILVDGEIFSWHGTGMLTNFLELKRLMLQWHQ